MAHLKSLNAVLLYCHDPAASSEFYRLLGFVISSTPSGIILATINDFAVELLDQATAKFQQDTKLEPKGAGVFLYVEVVGIDDYYNELLEKGLKPSSTPTDQPWGEREFAIKDPDGYRIVFWQSN